MNIPIHKRTMLTKTVLTMKIALIFLVILEVNKDNSVERKLTITLIIERISTTLNSITREFIIQNRDVTIMEMTTAIIAIIRSIREENIDLRNLSFIIDFLQE
jgi:hypothetical protein